jgi:hypothetical protein
LCKRESRMEKVVVVECIEDSGDVEIVDDLRVDKFC